MRIESKSPPSGTAWLVSAAACVTFSFVACSGAEDPAATLPTSPGVPQAVEVVLDAGDPDSWPAGATDACDALQMCVDEGGTYLLRGTFDLGEDQQVLLGLQGHEVVLKGDGTHDGSPATKVLGGFRSFLTVAPVVATVENLWFDGFTHTAIELAYNEDFLIKECRFSNGMHGPAPSSGRSEVFSVLLRDDEVGSLSGTVRVEDCYFDHNVHSEGSFYGPGFYSGGVGSGAVGQPGAPPTVSLYVQDNTFVEAGMLGGVVINSSWGVEAVVRDNITHMRRDWNYSAMYVAFTPAPIIEGNEFLDGWIYGIRANGIDGGRIRGNTLNVYDSVNGGDGWALSFFVDGAGAGTANVRIDGNTFFGQMDRAIQLSATRDFMVVNNDMTGASCYAASSQLLTLASYHSSTIGPADSFGSSIMNNHFPEVLEGEGWTFGIYRSGSMDPNLSNPYDNRFVGGNTTPSASFYDETDINPDPDVYEGMNRIIFPSFWKGTTPEHLGGPRGQEEIEEYLLD